MDPFSQPILAFFWLKASKLFFSSNKIQCWAQWNQAQDYQVSHLVVSLTTQECIVFFTVLGFSCSHGEIEVRKRILMKEYLSASGITLEMKSLSWCTSIFADCRKFLDTESTKFLMEIKLHILCTVYMFLAKKNVKLQHQKFVFCTVYNMTHTQLTLYLVL